jgi:hypothetical protein
MLARRVYRRLNHSTPQVIRPASIRGRTEPEFGHTRPSNRTICRMGAGARSQRFLVDFHGSLQILKTVIGGPVPFTIRSAVVVRAVVHVCRIYLAITSMIVRTVLRCYHRSRIRGSSERGSAPPLPVPTLPTSVRFALCFVLLTLARRLRPAIG